MPTISGELNFVSSRAAHVNEIWVRAPHVRTSTGGVVVTQNDRFPVKDGKVEFTCLTGPAILSLVSDGRAVDTVPIVVGESSSQALRQVVAAAQVADEATQSEIEKLAAQAVHLIDTSVESATRAESARDRAETAASGAAQSAKKSADSADKSGKSAKSASDSASAAKKSAGDASSSATAAKTAETKASSQASEAAKSATAAKADADRAAGVADSTSWKGDQLTVNGKTSPHLTGPKGDRGPAGESGKWTDLTGVPKKFPPEDHKHTSADISDSVEAYVLKADGKNANRLIRSDSRGRLTVQDANYSDTEAAVVNKKYVDSTAFPREVQLIKGEVDLDTYKETGIYHQNLDRDARAGQNYPNERAGLLEVFNPEAGMTYQRYTDYGVQNNVWTRGLYSGKWSRWVKVSQDGHKHTMAEITDLPLVRQAPTSETIVQRYSDGNISVPDTPGKASSATSKAYVDARIQLVSSLPSKPDSDVLYVIAE
ncbi:pyocin knob domain-containing protein [Corynebacterium marquesiae]|uniref:pyocin knob domain-containing protein n=1 Tax=Corynebacterium marquesiae TaxID=2913503 RepID=UPI0038CF7828